MSGTPYTTVSRDDSEERISSPRDSLLPTTTPILNRHTFPTSYKITFSPAIALRVVSTILALTTFIIFVIDGGHAFIAADIFLMILIIVNLIMILHYCISHLLKVTVELRQQPWNKDLGPSNKTKLSMYFDVGLSLIILLCIIIGNVATNRWRGAWKAAVVVGYFVVITQISQALPAMESKYLTLTASLSDSYVCLLY